ncbi:hypothetical protein A6V39_03705 [Candidatus Mycoplasma haematobovis]|uniref:Uncharacterized protein n=1 Tax=Candidatus Mycoplasma haematobovis TaxID=432608 RepID=A0A1A9QBN2_9MOLU|nr:hypothetical protein [Candidatus Mycoplasma haematobovis]OAL09992.1 hypothetical protein A6V39_03705 [Candidatus Mycoplasma haematobovis]
MDVKPLAVKAIAGLIGVGGVTGLTYHLTKSTSKTAKPEAVKNDMASRLTSEGYTLLSESSNNIDTILGSYKSIISSKNNLKFGEFGGVDVDGKKAKDELLKLCNSIFEETKNSNSYDKAIKWCIEPITASEILKKQNITALKTGTNADDDKAKWEDKIKKHIDSSNNLSKISQLNLTSTASQIVEGDYKIIQDKCDEIGKINNHTATFEDSLKFFKLWCSDS